MRAPRVSIVAVLLAAACAHGNGERARSADEPRAEREERREGKGERADNSRRDRAERERVDVPQSGRNRGQLANAGGELPEQQGHAHTPASADSFGSPPDNSRVNERDREKSALTPLDQSENEDDRELTRGVRQALIKDDSLSFTAKNVKIVTRNGHVTLRGPVNTEAERATIERAAQHLAGPTHVTNELEVSP